MFFAQRGTKHKLTSPTMLLYRGSVPTLLLYMFLVALMAEKNTPTNPFLFQTDLENHTSSKKKKNHTLRRKDNENPGGTEVASNILRCSLSLHLVTSLYYWLSNKRHKRLERKTKKICIRNVCANLLILNIKNLWFSCMGSRSFQSWNIVWQSKKYQVKVRILAFMYALNCCCVSILPRPFLHFLFWVQKCIHTDNYCCKFKAKQYPDSTFITVKKLRAEHWTLLTLNVCQLGYVAEADGPQTYL